MSINSFYFLHADVQLPICWKDYLFFTVLSLPSAKTSWLCWRGSTSLFLPLLCWSTGPFSHRYHTVCSFIRSLEVSWRLPTSFFSAASAALDLSSLHVKSIISLLPVTWILTSTASVFFFFLFTCLLFLKKPLLKKVPGSSHFLPKQELFFLLASIWYTSEAEARSPEAIV